MRGLEKEYEGRIEFIRANILLPENEPLMEAYGFSSTPKFYLVDAQGQVIGYWDGEFEAGDLRRTFEKALQTSDPE